MAIRNVGPAFRFLMVPVIIRMMIVTTSVLGRVIEANSDVFMTRALV